MSSYVLDVFDLVQDIQTVVGPELLPTLIERASLISFGLYDLFHSSDTDHSKTKEYLRSLGVRPEHEREIIDVLISGLIGVITTVVPDMRYGDERYNIRLVNNYTLIVERVS